MFVETCIIPVFLVHFNAIQLFHNVNSCEIVQCIVVVYYSSDRGRLFQLCGGWMTAGRRSGGVLRSWAFTPEDLQMFCIKCAVWKEGIVCSSSYPESLSGGWLMWHVSEQVQSHSLALIHFQEFRIHSPLFCFPFLGLNFNLLLLIHTAVETML